MSFENLPPIWKAKGAEPSTDLQNNGFVAGYKPPAEYFNYLFNRYSACINELQGIIAEMETSVAEIDSTITSQGGEISTIESSVSGLQTNVSSHTNNKNNPHGVTKIDVGLGNVPNVATNDQTPTFSVASTMDNIVSGEKLSTILGKVKKYFTELKGHAFNDPVNNLTTSTTGSALDASQGKFLQGEVDEINSNLVEQKMLGWTVPSECPIQNEVNGNQFIQKVGRVDLGSETSKNLSWTKYDGHGFNTRIDFTDVKPSGKCHMYDYPQGEGLEIPNTVSITDNNLIIITDDAYASVDAFLTAMSGKYLYYELATPITMTIDGNEVTERINDSLDSQGLLNKFDGVFYQGYYDTNGTEGNPKQNNRYVSNKNPINVYDGDIINIKYFGKTATTIFAQFYKSDGTNNGAIMLDNGSDLDSIFTVPTNSKTMHINIGNSDGISPNDISSLYISVNNEIAELKNDLGEQKKIYSETTINVGRKSGTTVGEYSTAEGKGNTASGNYSHAEGNGNTASGSGSHAEGNSTKATEGSSHAEGFNTTASGSYSHAEGNSTTASDTSSHAEGCVTTASGSYSHAEGYSTESTGTYSHAEGYNTTALTNQHAQGHYNNTTTATENSGLGTSTGTAFVIGNGSINSASNAFRVTGEGETIAKKAYSTTGADYAEYFEWEDGNKNKDDRRGLFVTLKGDKIKIANESDYILGIVSALPSVIGNHDEEWMGRYILDDFGDFITEKFEYEETEIDPETGEEKTIIKTGTKWKENPDYDSEKPYTPRAERPEWDAVGMLGVLNVIDDGSCKVNGFCKVVDGGTATASDTGYRVIKRVTDNIVKIVFS